MTTEEKTLLAVLTAAAVLVSAALGGALGWPMWSWLLLAVPLLSVPGLMARNIQRRVRPEWLREGYVAAPVQEVEQQPQDQQIPVADVTLPSAADGYAFHFSATVYWSPMGGSALQHANLAGLAADAVVSRARAITVTEQPSQVDAVAHRLAGALGAVQRDASGGVHAWADQVQLTLPEADQARLRRLSDARKDEDIWERELNYERCKRAYLADDVLRSTGSAVVWWLVQKDNDVEGTVPLIGALAQLSAAANDSEVPELFRHLVPVPALPNQGSLESLDGDQQFPNGPFHDGSRQAVGFPWAGFPVGPFSDTAGSVASRLGALMDTLDLGHEQCAQFARRFALLIENAGKPQEAQEIRRRFDAPAADEEPAGAPEPDSEPRDRPVPDEEPPPREEPWGNSALPGESEQDRDQQMDEQLRSEPPDEPSTL